MSVVEPTPDSGISFGGVVAKLGSINLLLVLVGLLTGPILARALGADGRGELAAILVPLTMAPFLLDLGLAQWAARERARGTPRAWVLGATLPTALGCSLVGVLGAIPFAQLIGRDHHTVVTFLTVGLFLSPVAVLLQTLSGLALGESRWGLILLVRLVGALLPALSIVLLALTGDLTVASAAAVSLGGAYAAAAMFLGMLRGVQSLPISGKRTAAAAAFGAKSWLTTLTGTANNRLDQLLMAGLLPTRELGLYAVAVTAGAASTSFVGSVSNALFPRVAAGDAGLGAKSCRVTIVLVLVFALLLSASAPFLVPFLFGDDFKGAVSMVIVLAASSIPMAGTAVLASALSAGNAPGLPLRAELVGLGITVPALLLLLPSHGGNGAAFVSLVAYTMRFGYLLLAARNRLRLPLRSFILPTLEDARWAKASLVHTVRRSS